MNDKCAKEHCPDIHDKSLYPCSNLYGVGYCEKGMNCEFSHEPFITEKDIEEFIKDKESFLIDVFRARKETTLGYYFIKHLNKLKQQNRKRFEQLKIELPSHMPPYISPKLLLPKNNFQQINSSFYNQSRGNMMQRGGYKGMMRNGNKMGQNLGMVPPGHVNIDGTGLLSSLKMGGRGNSFNFNPALQNAAPGSMMPKIRGNFAQGAMNLNLSNPYRANALNVTIPNHQQKQAMINATNFNTANLLNNRQKGIFNQNFNNMRHYESKPPQNIIPLINNLKLGAGADKNDPNAKQNMLLNQLNLAGKNKKEIAKHLEAGYLSRSDSKHQNLKLRTKNMRSGKDRVEKIFSKMMIRNKKKDSERLEHDFSSKMDKLRGMIFPQ